MKTLHVLSVLCASLILGGCGSIPPHRASQYRNDFKQWDPATQERLLAERVQLGDTREMVYVALGMPLKPPTLTADQPPLEHWEYFTYEVDPVPGATTPAVSSPEHPTLRAQTINNVVMVNPLTAPPMRLVVVEFGPDDRLAKWLVYPDAQGRTIGPDFKEIALPRSPRPRP